MLRDGDQLNIVRYHDGVFGQRIGPVASLAFHPTKASGRGGVDGRRRGDLCRFLIGGLYLLQGPVSRRRVYPPPRMCCR